MNTVLRILVLAGLTSLAVACSGNLTARSIQVGKSLNSDNSVGTLTTTFKPNDTIYAAVLTDGSGRGTLSAKMRLRAARMCRRIAGSITMARRKRRKQIDQVRATDWLMSR